MKILSLDGGGSWALIQARCLLDLYGDIPGNEVLKKFDMAVANSGGSMVLGCLIENMTLSQTVGMFRTESTRRDIFSKLTLLEKTLLVDVAKIGGMGPKYSTDKKLDGLHKHLPRMGNKYLSEVPALIGQPTFQVIICAFDYDRNREVFLRSNNKSLADSYYYDLLKNGNTSGTFNDALLAEAIHAASNAPVNYFNNPAKVTYRGETFKRQFWDGAIGGYNNPVFAGVLEAIVNGTKPEDITVLSLGTGSVQLPLLSSQKQPPTTNKFMYRKSDSNFVNDIEKLATSIVDDPPDSANFHAYAIMHPGLQSASDRFFRFSPLVTPANKNGQWNVPKNFTAKQFESLIDLDMDAVQQSDVDLIELLCTEWMNPSGEIINQAIRANSNFDPIIGYGTYKDAKAAVAGVF